MAGIRPSATGRTTLAGLPSNKVRRAAWKAAHHCEQRLAGTFPVNSRSEIVERGLMDLAFWRHGQGDIESCAAIRIVLRPEPPALDSAKERITRRCVGP